MKRYASHYLLLPDQTLLTHQIIEVEEGRVIRYYPLEEELEDTLWVPGEIKLDKENRPTAVLLNQQLA